MLLGIVWGILEGPILGDSIGPTGCKKVPMQHAARSFLHRVAPMQRGTHFFVKTKLKKLWLRVFQEVNGLLS